MPDGTAPEPPPRAGMDLTEGPILRTLLLFSLPMLGANILQSLSGSVNAIWVGRFLGETALAATSNANNILFFLLSIVFGLGMAGTILIGQAMGAKDPDFARRVIGTATIFFLVVSAVFAVAGFLLTPAVLRLMDTPLPAQPMAIRYLRILFCALPFFYFQSFLMMALRGAGDSRTPLAFVTLAVVLDVGLNPLLILGIGPFPRLGIGGAAAATLVSTGLSVAAMVVWLYARRHPLRLTRAEFGYLRPDPEILGIMLTKGLPMGLQMVVISGSGIVLMGLVNSFGITAAAAFGVSAQLWNYIQMPAMAIGAAVSSMAAQNVGAGRWDRMGRIATRGVAVNVAMTGSVIALLAVFDRQALGLFLPPGSPAIPVAVHINLIVSWSFMLFGATMVLFGVIRSTGAVIPALVILFVSMILVRVPFAELLSPSWGADAIWWCFPLGSVVSLALTLTYYRFGGWRDARMIPQAAPLPG